jgi:hypothetical protein
MRLWLSQVNKKKKKKKKKKKNNVHQAEDNERNNAIYKSLLIAHILKLKNKERNIYSLICLRDYVLAEQDDTR